MQQKFAVFIYSLSIGISLMSAALTTANAQGSAAKERKKSQFGDIKIFDFDTSRGKTDLSGVILTGSKTTIEVPDKKSHSLITLHANEITIQKQKKDIEAQLNGNVHFHIVQKQNAGPDRILDGTSRAGNYDRASQTYRMSGNVHISVIDPAKITGTGTLQSDTFMIVMSDQQTVYQMTGNPASNSIHFMPLPASSASKASGSPSDDVRLSGFNNGSLTFGESALLEGHSSKAQFSRASDRTDFTVNASNIAVQFHGNGDTVSHTSAAGNVELDLIRTVKDNSKERLIAKCDTADYNLLEQKMLLKHNIHLSLTSPDSLRKPASIISDELNAVFGDRETYSLKGNPAITRIVVAPKAAKPTQPAAADKGVQKPVQPQPASTLTISRFTSGEFTPGMEAELTGENTTVVSAADDHTSSLQIQASKISMVLTEDNSLQRAEAMSHVRFNLTQTPDPPAVKKTVTGTASKALYTSSEKLQQIVVDGPIEAKFTDPENLAEPGIIQGLTGDALHLLIDDAGLHYEIESEKQTATIQFTPKDKTDEADKKPSSTGNKSKKRNESSLQTSADKKR